MFDHDLRAKLVQHLVDHEYPLTEDMSPSERQAVDIERQSFALRVLGPMSIKQLQDSCRRALGQQPL